MTDFNGLVAIVTGGGSGIGAATVHELTTRGAQVAIIDRSLPDRGRHAFAAEADITDDKQVTRAVEAIATTLGRIDVLINNAGTGATGDVTTNEDDEWHHVFDVNVIGIARVTRHALPWLRKSGAGSIVNTASIAGTTGLPQRALYSATKGAVIALTYAMAADLLRERIRVNAVAPGTADTPWVQRLVSAAEDPEKAVANLRGRQPLGRLVTADEVAYAIVNLASPKAASTTGTVLTVDGGLTNLKI